MTDERMTVGRRGEDLVAAHLERRGWCVLARNWRCAEGEIDLVATDPAGVAVVCEVKTRRGLGYGSPLEAVTWAKARRLRRLAAAWARAQGVGLGGLRVDAFGVLVHPDGTASIQHVSGVDG
ncbi:YraN family protein [Propioniciclava soli]|uniref:UPF0102 protein PCC79_05945 n=1 Tax=Propioniciclava soli TaxID=2775081 RepID=A0ABZ3CAU9_9ACTN